jgi:Ulp1 family protease
LLQGWKPEIKAYHPNVPKQTNGTDCGLFLLENVESFLEDPDFVLSNLNAKKGELFTRKIVDEKREYFKRFVIAAAEKT